MPEYIRTPNTACGQCKKPIYRRPSEIARKTRGNFCDQKCYGLAQRKEKPCVVCKKLMLSSANSKTCSRTCSNINRTGIHYRTGRRKDKVFSQKHLKIRLLEQRGRQCERCTYKKYQVLHVHHKDRDRTNSNVSNLELLCPNCHAEEHYLKNSKF